MARPLRGAGSLRGRPLRPPLAPLRADDATGEGERRAWVTRGACYSCPVLTCPQRFRREMQRDAHVAAEHSLAPRGPLAPAHARNAHHRHAAGASWDDVAPQPVLPALTDGPAAPPRSPQRLQHDLAALFGQLPLSDPFDLAVCSRCSLRLTPAQLVPHLRQLHGEAGATPVRPPPMATAYSARKPARPPAAGKASARRGHAKPAGPQARDDGLDPTWGQLSARGRQRRRLASPPPAASPASSSSSTDDADDTCSLASSSSSSASDPALGSKVAIAQSCRRFASLRGQVGVVTKAPLSARDSWYTVQLLDDRAINVRLRDLDLLAADPRPDLYHHRRLRR